MRRPMPFHFAGHGSGRSAMMRPLGNLRSFPGFLARGALCLQLASAAASPGAALAQADSAVGGPAWLPLPVEDLDHPELLDEPFAPELGFQIRADVRDGSLRQARSAAEASARGVTSGAALLLGPGGETQAWTAWLRGVRPGLEAGRLAPHGIAPLLAEELELASSSGHVPRPRTAAPTFEAPASAATRLVDGAALEWRAERGLGAWVLGGRRVEDGARLAAMGAAFRGRRSAWSATLARSDSGWTAGLAALRRSVRGLVAIEAVRGPSGAALVAYVARSAGPLRAEGRVRWRSRELRGVASEIACEAGSRRARLRLRLEGYPSGATGSASRVEVEGRVASGVPGPMAFRVGGTRSESFSNAAGYHTGVERYGVAEWTLARAAGRTLTLLASRRDKETAAGVRRGTSLGGRLGIEWPGRARVELQLEGVRAETDGAAWSSGLYAGGATALRTYARPGVAAQARGEVRIGRWRVGALLEERDDASGTEATAASIWIGHELRGREPAKR